MKSVIDHLISELEDLYHLSKIKSINSKLCDGVDLLEIYLKYDAQVTIELKRFTRELEKNGCKICIHIHSLMTAGDYESVIAILKTCKEQL